MKDYPILSEPSQMTCDISSLTEFLELILSQGYFENQDLTKDSEDEQDPDLKSRTCYPIL